MMYRVDTSQGVIEMIEIKAPKKIHKKTSNSKLQRPEAKISKGLLELCFY